LGWLWTVILLMSASWVAKITGVSHWLHEPLEPGTHDPLASASKCWDYRHGPSVLLAQVPPSHLWFQGCVGERSGLKASRFPNGMLGWGTGEREGERPAVPGPDSLSV
jgi:hypothetical protein